MSKITLRRASADDAEAFVRIMGDPAVLPQLMQMPWPSRDEWRARLSAPSEGGTELRLVAEAEAQVVGIGGLHPAGPALRRRHAMQLSLCVATAWQGRGVGQALMQALCDHADRWLGARRVELQVYADNARAIALYKRFGFEVEGRHRGYGLRDGQLVDSLSMARLVPPPPLTPHEVA